MATRIAKINDHGLNFVKMGTKVHMSFSNLPLAEWHHGVTLCRRTGKLWRVSNAERFSFDQICKQCRRVVER